MDEVMTSGYTELAQSYMVQPRVMRLSFFGTVSVVAAGGAAEALVILGKCQQVRV
jgi:hypothetical protein